MTNTITYGSTNAVIGHSGGNTGSSMFYAELGNGVTPFREGEKGYIYQKSNDTVYSRESGNNSIGVFAKNTPLFLSTGASDFVRITDAGNDFYTAGASTSTGQSGSSSCFIWYMDGFATYISSTNLYRIDTYNNSEKISSTNGAAYIAYIGDGYALQRVSSSGHIFLVRYDYVAKQVTETYGDITSVVGLDNTNYCGLKIGNKVWIQRANQTASSKSTLLDITNVNNPVILYSSENKYLGGATGFETGDLVFLTTTFPATNHLTISRAFNIYRIDENYNFVGVDIPENIATIMSSCTLTYNPNSNILVLADSEHVEAFVVDKKAAIFTQINLNITLPNRYKNAYFATMSDDMTMIGISRYADNSNIKSVIYKLDNYDLGLKAYKDFGIYNNSITTGIATGNVVDGKTEFLGYMPEANISVINDLSIEDPDYEEQHIQEFVFEGGE